MDDSGEAETWPPDASGFTATSISTPERWSKSVLTPSFAEICFQINSAAIGSDPYGGGRRGGKTSRPGTRRWFPSAFPQISPGVERRELLVEPRRPPPRPTSPDGLPPTVLTSSSTFSAVPEGLTHRRCLPGLVSLICPKFSLFYFQGNFGIIQ